MIEYFYVATELAKTRRNYVTIEQLCVATESARVRRISVAAEDFYVATELATIKSSATQDRAWSCEEVPMSRPNILGCD